MGQEMTDVLVVIAGVAGIVTAAALIAAVIILVVKGLQWFRKWMVER